MVDAFGRIKEVVHDTVGKLSPNDLAFRVDKDANSISWLIWHLTRVQDDHMSELADIEQAWSADGWFEKFDLPFDVSATGYGHTSDDVERVRVSADLLTGYYDAVHERTVDFIKTLTAKDFEKVVDDSWDPPVTMAVRIVSVLSDDLQHCGQAAFVRGLL